MSIKEFLIKLNSLAKYVVGMANSKRGKLDVFMGGLKLYIVKDVMIRDNLPKNFFKDPRSNTKI